MQNKNQVDAACPKIPKEGARAGHGERVQDGRVKMHNRLCRYPHPMMALAGFEVRQLRWCTMHCINLGALQAFNGSVLSLLCSNGFFNIGGRASHSMDNDQMREFSARFRSWARVKQIECLGAVAFFICVCCWVELDLFKALPGLYAHGHDQPSGRLSIPHGKGLQL